MTTFSASFSVALAPRVVPLVFRYAASTRLREIKTGATCAAGAGHGLAAEGLRGMLTRTASIATRYDVSSTRLIAAAFEERQGLGFGRRAEFLSTAEVRSSTPREGLNSSSAFSLSDVKDMIAHQQDRYSWKFLFLGANQDAFAEAGKLGVAPAMAAKFVADAEGMLQAYRSSSKAVQPYRQQGRIDLDWKRDIN